MVTLNVGLNRVRDLFNSDIFKCQAGTGTTSPTVADTGLETADATTLLAPTNTTADRAVQSTHLVPSTVGSGTAYAEQETQLNSGATSANRIVHTAQTKGAAEEFNYITNWFFDRGQ